MCKLTRTLKFKLGNNQNLRKSNLFPFFVALFNILKFAYVVITIFDQVKLKFT